MRSKLATLLGSLRQLAAAPGGGARLLSTSARAYAPAPAGEAAQPAAPASGREAAGEAEYRAIEARIFGNRLGNGQRSGAKVLRRKLLGDKVAGYYPTPFSKGDPAFVSLRSEGQKAKLEKLKRRGKGPPPKGQGKRTAGGKKKK